MITKKEKKTQKSTANRSTKIKLSKQDINSNNSIDNNFDDNYQFQTTKIETRPFTKSQNIPTYTSNSNVIKDKPNNQIINNTKVSANVVNTKTSTITSTTQDTLNQSNTKNLPLFVPKQQSQWSKYLGNTSTTTTNDNDNEENDIFDPTLQKIEEQIVGDDEVVW